jgi:hypothetical protein
MTGMSAHAIEDAKTAWPRLEQEQSYGLLAVAMANELIEAGFGPEFPGDDSEDFSCARAFICRNARVSQCSLKRRGA